MPYRRHRPDALTRLVLAFRAAAHSINVPAARLIAAREAERIPQTRVEKSHGAKAKVAEQGRAILRHLPTMEAQEYPEAARDLRACGDALQSAFTMTSEVKLGDRRRRA